MANIVMASIVMAHSCSGSGWYGLPRPLASHKYIVMAYTVMAYIVMAYIVMAYIVMAYIVMAYIVMAAF